MTSKTLINYIIKDYELNDDSVEELILPNCVYLINSFNAINLKHVVAPNLKIINDSLAWSRSDLKIDAPNLIDTSKIPTHEVKISTINEIIHNVDGKITIKIETDDNIKDKLHNMKILFNMYLTSRLLPPSSLDERTIRDIRQEFYLYFTVILSGILKPYKNNYEILHYIYQELNSFDGIDEIFQRLPRSYPNEYFKDFRDHMRGILLNYRCKHKHCLEFNNCKIYGLDVFKFIPFCKNMKIIFNN